MPAHSTNHFLRHCLATLAYRGGKTLRGVPDGFAAFRVAPGTRTPAEILAHIGDLLDWAVGLAQGRHVWRDSTPLPWDSEVARFFAGLEVLDRQFAENALEESAMQKIFQGPIADALTHVGQLGMLRRLAGSPVRGENYFRAHIEVGSVRAEQAPAVREFD